MKIVLPSQKCLREPTRSCLYFKNFKITDPIDYRSYKIIISTSELENGYFQNHQNLYTVHPSRCVTTYYNNLNQSQQAILWGMHCSFNMNHRSLRQASEIT